MRRIIPYVPFGARQHPGPALPIDAPTLATRRNSSAGDNPARGKLVTMGGLCVVVPIQAPFAGQGATFPAFPLVQPSKVAPNAIKPNIIVAMNDFSPSGHSDPHTVEVPAIPLAPTGTGRSPKRGLSRAAKPNLAQRGTGGNYTIPSPLANVRYPTSADWLRQRMAVGR